MDMSGLYHAPEREPRYRKIGRWVGPKIPVPGVNRTSAFQPITGSYTDSFGTHPVPAV
jgi:hypothetical protein